MRVAASVDTLLTRLEQHGARGTFFVLGWLARHRPEVVRAIADSGNEVASHGFWHERVTTLDRASFREDIRASKRALEDLIGVPVLGYRAPNFSIVPGGNGRSTCCSRKATDHDSSIFPIRRSGYGYPDAPRIPHLMQRTAGQIAEFPLATTEILSSSCPPPAAATSDSFPTQVIRRAFREATEREEPTTFYIDPWEIDPGQPRFPVSKLTRIRHYRGLDGALRRIDPGYWVNSAFERLPRIFRR